MSTTIQERIRDFPLLQALIERRSRRFGRGMRLAGGPLSYQSCAEPDPLTEEEEAALAFAACGLTGYALAELPYQAGPEPESGGGNIMTHFIGRTAPSGDAMHNCTVFVSNDRGTCLLRRPQDYPREQLRELLREARHSNLVELFHRARIHLSDKRLTVPPEVPFVAPFNKWAANVPGTTYFLPVAELTTLFINILLSAYDHDFAFFIVDDHNGYQPAGVAAFARSAGGHLEDDPSRGRVTTIGSIETWLCEFVAIEQGAILQNLGLMAAALGLGGFPHFAAHPFIWPLTLGFRVNDVSYHRLIGAPPGGPGDMPVPTPVGLERGDEVLLRPFCPPYYRDMEAAVLAFVDYKYAAGKGTFRDGGSATGWRDGATVQSGIPPYSDEAIDATIACCSYIFERYGRLPPSSGPFRTVLAYQAHRLDADFYRRYYRDDIVP